MYTAGYSSGVGMYKYFTTSDNALAVKRRYCLHAYMTNLHAQLRRNKRLIISSGISNEHFRIIADFTWSLLKWG